MPDLSLQKGTLTGIGEFDFLTARCEASYEETDNGTVSFTGESSFRHAYSFVSITIKKDLSEENVLIGNIRPLTDWIGNAPNLAACSGLIAYFCMASFISGAAAPCARKPPTERRIATNRVVLRAPDLKSSTVGLIS